MITVVGEALIDLVIEPDGSVVAKLGGAPFNTARASARLGAEVSFVGALSRDRFGDSLTDQLVADGVDVSRAPRVELPTTLAAAELDESGAATYRFYIDGTSAPQLTAIDHPASGSDIVFTGGLGLVLEPMAATVEALVGARDDHHDDQLVMIDVNCRPKIVPDRDAYVARVDRVVGHADVVKVSDEDVAYLRPDMTPEAVVDEILAAGAQAVLLTQGGGAVRVACAAGTEVVDVDPVDVVDTIGAGDSFGGGFLAWWVASGFGLAEAGSLDHLVAAVRAANRVAGVVVTRRGADPPWRHELPADWSP